MISALLTSQFLGFYVFMAAFVGIIAMAISIIIGAAIMSLILFAIFLFISAGIISSSVLVGMHQRSISEGFKFLIISIFTGLGCIGIGGIFLILNQFFHWFSFSHSIVIGLFAGGMSGYSLGNTVYYLLKFLSEFLLNKLNINNN